MNTESRSYVRRLTPKAAVAEALRIAGDFLDSNPSGHYSVRACDAVADPIDPAPVGKTPSKWVIHSELRTEAGEAVDLDSPPLYSVDLVEQKVTPLG